MPMTDLPATWIALPTRRELLDGIERLDISADAKLLLSNLATMTLNVGGRLIEAGRRILAFAFELARAFPNTAFGVIIAVIASMLIASVPLLGGLLGPLLAPLLIAFGLTSGALTDLKDGSLRRRVATLEDEFRVVAS